MNILDNIIEEMINKNSSEDFKICCKCENGVKSIQVEGKSFSVILGLIVLEKVILSKTNIDKEKYEFLREHVGYDVL